MNIETTKENVCINQLIEQKNETRIIEEDVIVPDIKPDVLSIIKVNIEGKWTIRRTRYSLSARHLAWYGRL